jgi:hypothetical protein
MAAVAVAAARQPRDQARGFSMLAANDSTPSGSAAIVPRMRARSTSGAV